MELTDAHRRVLEAIGVKGGGREKLGEAAGSVELREVVAFGFARHAPVGEIDIWFLTREGADAIGEDPELVPSP